MPNDRGGHGQCLCGGVRYRVNGKLQDVWACHCSQCRRTTGHFFASTACARTSLHLEAAETLAWYESSPGIRRGFCNRCGSSLFWDNSRADHISILAGTLDAPTGLKFAGHIFLADKGDYYAIADDLPHYEQSWED